MIRYEDLHSSQESGGLYHEAEILYSDWEKWSKLSNKDKWWSTKRAESVNKWLNDQKGSTELPGGPLLLS